MRQIERSAVEAYRNQFQGEPARVANAPGRAKLIGGQVCEQASLMLSVTALRDARIQDLEQLSGEELKRARHVVTEDERVLEAVTALRRRDFVTFGRLMYESHRSLRDDYEVSTHELDTFVELAAQGRTLGARLTGAGFGGCAIALIRNEDVERLAQSVQYTFTEQGFKQPALYSFQPAVGAEVVQ